MAHMCWMAARFWSTLTWQDHPWFLQSPLDQDVLATESIYGRWKHRQTKNREKKETMVVQASYWHFSNCTKMGCWFKGEVCNCVKGLHFGLQCSEFASEPTGTCAPKPGYHIYLLQWFYLKMWVFTPITKHTARQSDYPHQAPLEIFAMQDGYDLWARPLSTYVCYGPSIQLLAIQLPIKP